VRATPVSASKAHVAISPPIASHRRIFALPQYQDSVPEAAEEETAGLGHWECRIFTVAGCGGKMRKLNGKMQSPRGMINGTLIAIAGY
jgi:hypothetical protein